MATTIKFDSTEIANTTYIPRFVKHESVADRQISSLPLSREDGEIMISERYGTKRIFLQGILTGATQSALETAIDTFKELFSRPEKNLDVDWAGGTLRFVATCARHEFDRDHFHNLFVPWTAEFLVLSGEGKDTATTAALTDHALTVTTPAADSFTMLGSKPAKPVITLQGNSWPGSALGFQYKDTDTGEKFIYTCSRVWAGTKSVIIDTLLKKVTSNIGYSTFVEDKFYGVFPQFRVGTNNIELTVGNIINQTTGDSSVADLTDGVIIDGSADRFAQSFSVPYSDETFQGITLALKKTGSPGDMTVRIETDLDGQPSGDLAHANSTFTISVDDVSSTKAYATFNSTNAWPLAGNTTYWIVIKATGLSAGIHEYTVYLLDYTDAVFLGLDYTRGVYAASTDSGATYVLDSRFDISFRLLFGGKAGSGTVKHSVSYTKTYL